MHAARQLTPPVADRSYPPAPSESEHARVATSCGELAGLSELGSAFKCTWKSATLPSASPTATVMAPSAIPSADGGWHAAEAAGAPPNVGAWCGVVWCGCTRLCAAMQIAPRGSRHDVAYERRPGRSSSRAARPWRARVVPSAHATTAQPLVVVVRPPLAPAPALRLPPAMCRAR